MNLIDNRNLGIPAATEKVTKHLEPASHWKFFFGAGRKDVVDGCLAKEKQTPEVEQKVEKPGEMPNSGI